MNHDLFEICRKDIKLNDTDLCIFNYKHTAQKACDTYQTFNSPAPGFVPYPDRGQLEDSLFDHAMRYFKNLGYFKCGQCKELVVKYDIHFCHLDFMMSNCKLKLEMEECEKDVNEKKRICQIRSGDACVLRCQSIFQDRYQRERYINKLPTAFEFTSLEYCPNYCKTENEKNYSCDPDDADCIKTYDEECHAKCIEQVNRNRSLQDTATRAFYLKLQLFLGKLKNKQKLRNVYDIENETKTRNLVLIMNREQIYNSIFLME